MRRSKATALSAILVLALTAVLTGSMSVSPVSSQERGEAMTPPEATDASDAKMPENLKNNAKKVPAQATTTEERLTEAERRQRSLIEARRIAEAEAADGDDAETWDTGEDEEAEEETRPLDPLQEKIRRSERRAIFTPRAYTNDEPEDELSPTQLLILDLLSRDSRPVER